MMHVAYGRDGAYLPPTEMNNLKGESWRAVTVEYQGNPISMGADFCGGAALGSEDKRLRLLSRLTVPPASQQRLSVRRL